MKHTAAFIAVALILAVGIADVFAYSLTLDQRERFKVYMPRSFTKLEARDPVHVVIIGDGVMGGMTPLEGSWENGNPLFSYVGMFLGRLAREFFYPGGVRIVNPPEGGTEKVSPYLADEITLENLTNPEGTVFDGLRHIHTDVFVHNPDLLLVQYGIYDAFGRISIDSYKQALQEIVAVTQERGTDIIILGPTLANYGSGAMEWGITRPYATAAREVASSNRVLFIDAGSHLTNFSGGVDPDNHPKAAMEIVGDRLSRIFNFGPELRTRERIHPGPRANEFLGDAIFRDLKNGPKQSDYTFTALAGFDNSESLNVTLVLQNQSDEKKEGSIGALAVGESLVPIDAAQRYVVGPGEAVQLQFRYQREVVGKSRDGSDLFFPMEPNDELGRFNFVLEDTVSSELVDVPVRIGPVTALWKSRQYVNVNDKLQVDWDLVNGTDKALAGTFQVGLANQFGQPSNFSVSPLGTKSIFSIFPFNSDPGTQQIQKDTWIQIEVEGRKVRFSRELEATRDLVLGESIRLQPWNSYGNAPPAGGDAALTRSSGDLSLLFEADEEALYVITRLEGLRIPDLGENAAIRARLFLDARPAEEVRTFGAVEAMEIYTRGTDGPGITSRLPLGSFGNGYNMRLINSGVTSVLETAGDGARLLTIRIPRSYLHRHEWNLGEADSILGYRMEITVADPLPDAPELFPFKNRFESNSPTFSHEDRIIHGFHENDARSLSTLRLSRQPVNSWSVRIY